MSLRSVSCLAVAVAVASSASASVVVGWTINTAFPTGTGNVPTGNTYLPPNPAGAGLAETGDNIAGSQLSAFHSVAAATYTSPSGNGSQYAFSSNNWNPGDYYEARFSTLGFSDLTLTWDQTRSSTGPINFKVAMSIDGGANFTDLSTYTVLQSGGGGAPGTWTTTTPLAIYSNSVSLGASAENLSLVIVRFIDAEAAASAAAGSSRIDNVFVYSGPVPAPGAIALLGLAGLASRRRR